MNTIINLLCYKLTILTAIVKIIDQKIFVSYVQIVIVKHQHLVQKIKVTDATIVVFVMLKEKVFNASEALLAMRRICNPETVCSIQTGGTSINSLWRNPVAWCVWDAAVQVQILVGRPLLWGISLIGKTLALHA